MLGVVAVVVVLAIVGRTPGRSILSHSSNVNAPPRLSESLILTALASLGIGELNSAIRKAEKDDKVGCRVPRAGPGGRARLAG